MKRHGVALLVAIALLLTSSRALPQVPTEPQATIQPPVLIQPAEPVYPIEARHQNITGQVILALDIDEQGKVTRAQVQEPAGHGFDEAAQEAAMRLVFRPATRAGKNVPCRIRYRSTFALRPSVPSQPSAPALPPVGRIKGKVRIADQSIPIAGALVRATLSNGGIVLSSTDAAGNWEIRDVPFGSVAVEVIAAGYETHTFRATVAKAETLEVVVRLRALSKGQQVVIRGSKPDQEITRRTLQRRELALVPGTQGDVLAAVGSMPSVARAPALSGMVIVRGTSPQGTAVFIDQTPVPMAYHFGGLASVVPTEMVQAIDFYPGNFSARYGRVQGGIIDVRLRELNHDGRYHGLAQVDLIDARVMLSGPVPFIKGWSMQMAGRRSHVDAWIGGLMVDFASLRTAPVYYDWQLLTETKPTPTSMLRLGWFGADDRIALVLNDAIATEPALGQGVSNSSSMSRFQGAYRGQLSSTVRISASASVGIDHETTSMGPIQADVTYHPISLRGEWVWKPSEQVTIRLGPDVVSTQYAADVISTILPDSSSPDAGPISSRPLLRWKKNGWMSTPAVWGELEWTPDPRVKFLYGARADHHDLTHRTDLSPRFNARYDLHHPFPRTTLKTGVGMFYQPPQPVEAVDVFGTPNLQSNRSVHHALGLEQELTEALEVSVEGFYKDLDNLVVRQSNADGSLGYANLGKGATYGADLLLRHRPVGRLFGWVAYTLSRSTRIDAPDKDPHVFEYDQTHILTAVGSYEVGRGWRVGARFRLVSGNPITPCLGGVQDAGTGTYACRTGPLFSQRLPAFHQGDVRIDKTWSMESWRLTAYLDVQNVYNRQNPEAVQYNYNYTRFRYQSGLPIIPSFGLRGEF